MNKTFIKYALLFFIPVVLGYMLIECITLSLPSPYEKNEILLKQNSDDIRTLILGSSQMSHAINAGLLSETSINLSSGNQHHDTDFKLLKALQPRLSSLKTVILEVSYSHFELPHNGTDFWKNSVFLKYYDINCFERRTYFKDELIYLSFPRFFSEMIIDQYITKEDPAAFNTYGFDTLNYNGLFKDLDYDEAKIADVLRFKINTEENLDLFQNNTKLFFEMLDFLNEQDLNVIICNTPMYKTYLPKRNTSILNRRDSILSVVASRYPNIQFLNKEEDTTLFDVRDYWNQSHLNPDGASKFTKMLENELSKPH